MNNTYEIRDKIFAHPDGKKYNILTGKAINDRNRSIYILSNLENKMDYSLWYFEYLGDGDFDMWPYDGENSEEIIKELLEKYVETAYK